MMDFILSFLPLAAGLIVVWWGVDKYPHRRRQRQEAANMERDDALFRAMFPELQPHYHPARLIHFVRARRRRKALPGLWRNPPGFDADSAETILEGGKERVRLRDKDGAPFQEFLYEERSEGGALRVGEGELTVDIRDASRPGVRYRHPERGFAWRRRQWTFQSPLADRPIESGDRSRFSGDERSGSAARRAAGSDFEVAEHTLSQATAY